MPLANIQDRREDVDHAIYVRRAQVTFDILLRGKWRLQILFALRHGRVRLGQLKRLIPGASKKVLAHNLRMLEADGIVIRRDMSDVVLHIEYELRDEIKDSLGALLDQLSEWGESYLDTSSRKEKG